MENKLWQPNRETRAAISRGDKLNREYFKRKDIEYQLAMMGRIAARQEFKGAR